MSDEGNGSRLRLILGIASALVTAAGGSLGYYFTHPGAPEFLGPPESIDARLRQDEAQIAYNKGQLDDLIARVTVLEHAAVEAVPDSMIRQHFAEDEREREELEARVVNLEKR
jgi:hypothetical protein